MCSRASRQTHNVAARPLTVATFEAAAARPPRQEEEGTTTGGARTFLGTPPSGRKGPSHAQRRRGLIF